MATLVASQWRYGMAAVNRDRAVLQAMANQCHTLILSTAQYAPEQRRLAGKLYTMQAAIQTARTLLDAIAVRAGDPEPPEPVPVPAEPEPMPVPDEPEAPDEPAPIKPPEEPQ